MIKSHLDPVDSPGFPLYLDGSVYKLDLSNSDSIDLADLDGLPSLEYALYLTNTVKFHLGQLFHMFDEASFMPHLHEFYNNPVVKIKESRLWFIQYLLIIAFGKAFLVQDGPSKLPPGFTYFARAMNAMPGMVVLFEDPVLSVEILCSVSLYLQSADNRNSAYVYVS
jgi:proline utilization trans-activator